MKKKMTQTVEITNVGGRREAKSSRQRAAEAKRSKGGEGVLGLDHRRARTPRRRRTTLSVESCHRRRSHEPTRALTRTHAPARGRQAAGEEPRVTARGMLVSGGVATGV